MMNELDYFNKIHALVGRLTDKSLGRILDQTNAVVKQLVKSNYYKEVEADILNGEIDFTALVQLAKSVEILAEHDINLIIWATGFKVATQTKDSDFLLFQTAAYIASQRANRFRIEDDKLRLVLTFMHLEALRMLIIGEE